MERSDPSGSSEFEIIGTGNKGLKRRDGRQKTGLYRSLDGITRLGICLATAGAGTGILEQEY